MSASDRPGIRLDNDQRIAWLRLIRSENIGPATFRDLINHFGSGQRAIDAVPELAARGGRRIRLCTLEEAEDEFEKVSQFGGQLVAMGEPDYPPWLRHIPDVPPLVTIRGNLSCVTRPCVAIVGSRNASVAGRKVAATLARQLGEYDYVVPSGLARGIDAAAHAASLDGGTVAVLAGGIDKLYPPENLELADSILESHGAHITEMPFGWVPRGRDFPRRNRVISGLSLGVVVVEAAVRSGSLITARRAAEQGRLVFSVPGSPLDPRAAGSNQLIKDGAQLVTEIADIIAALEPMRREPPPEVDEEGRDDDGEAPPPTDVVDSDRNAVLEALGPTPVEIDEIIRFTGLKPAAVHLVLLELALAGRLERHPGQRVSIV